MFVGVPASIGLLLVRGPLTAVILQGAAFTVEDTRRTAFILMGYAPAIWAYSLNQVFVRAFYARGEAMTPVKVAIGMAVLNLTLNLILIWTPLGIAGLAWSTAICAILQTFLLHALLERRLPGILDHSVVPAILRILILSAFTAAATLIASWLMAPGDESARWSYQLLSLVVIVGSGGGAAFLCARALRMPELFWLLGRRAGPDHS